MSRQGAEKELDLLVSTCCLDQMEVVKDEGDLVRHDGEGLNDAREQRQRRHGKPAVQPLRRLLDLQGAARSFEGSCHVGPEATGVVVTDIEGHPGDCPTVVGVQPLRSQGGLAVASGRGQQRDRLTLSALHGRDEARSGDPGLAARRGL